MAANITEYLSNIQELTKQNLTILNTLKEAFHTKAEYLQIEVGNNKFNVPSFISLENRLNTLQANFENLVEAPTTGTASFVFDGATKTIQCGGFNICPDKVTLDEVSTFNIEHNDVLKDFMTPKPYVKFGIASIPNNISNVMVRKYVIFNDEIRSLLFTSGESSNSVSYANVVAAIENYTEDVDYQVYDTYSRLPLRDNIGRGVFNILSINDTDVTEKFTQYYTVQLDNITYTVDTTNPKLLQKGDILVTYNNECRLKIVELNDLTNVLTLEVLNNGYSNLTTEKQGGDLGKLKFYSSPDYDIYKYVQVPLEENQYIIVFIAPVYDNLNTRAEWSNGIAINTYNLTVNIDGEDWYFKDYYNTYVTNIGDGIMNLVTMMSDMMSNYSKAEWEAYSSAKPVFEDYVVTQINSHISNSETYKKIKSLYASKQNNKNELNSVQTEIDSITNILAQIDFDDTNGSRKVYENQLTSLNARKVELNNTIASIVQEIASNAVNSDLSLDGAKYHIRAIFDVDKFLKENDIRASVASIKVLYRYKNATKDSGQALSIKDKTYSDWNIQETRSHKMKPSKYNLTNYMYDYIDEDGPQFNYVDIPISQGETVDVKLQVIYTPGYPFIEFTSAWSDIVNVEFPEEYTKDVTILDIVEENNEDVKSYQFTSLLDSTGISSHCANTIVDQDITFLHKPEDISSGFYTEERRIIPLKDKLQDMVNIITQLQDEVLNTGAQAVDVTISDTTGFEQKLEPFAKNTFQTTEFKNTTDKSIQTFINIKNTSKHSVKLFSPYFGSRSAPISSENINGDKNAHGIDALGFVTSNKLMPQTLGQIIYFNKKSYFTGEDLFVGFEDDTPIESEISISKSKKLGTWNTGKLVIEEEENTSKGVLSCVMNTEQYSAVLLPSDTTYYRLLNANETIQIPISVLGITPGSGQTIEFIIKPAAHLEPVIYEVTYICKNNNTLEDNLRRTATTNNYKSIVL